MPAQYIEDVFASLNLIEKKSIDYHFTKQKISEDLLLRRYIENFTNPKPLKLEFEGRNRMLRSRAFDQLTDILISDYHINSKGNFGPHDQILLRLKKKILFARVTSKNLDQTKLASFKTFLNSIISEAKKNEVYEVLVEALLLKKYFFALKQSAREFDKIDKLILFYEAAQKKVYQANDCYFKIIMNTHLVKIGSTKSFHNYIVKTIRNLKNDYSIYRSEQINYYLHIIIMYYYEKQKKYALSAKYCKVLLSIVQNSSVVYREERIGNVLVNLSQYKTFTNNYNEAAKYAKEAQKHYLENSNNYLLSKDLEFTIYFYNRKFEKAEGCMRDLQTHKLIDSGQFTNSKYTYYHSALLFMQKKYKQSYALLNKSLEIEKDKSKWNISLRITNIMLCIELNRIDEASRLLESLRKYIQRNEKTAEFRLRDLLISKTLREMEKDGFNFNRQNNTVNKLLRELSLKGKNTSWEHYSPELVPFHEWLGSKYYQVNFNKL